MKLQLRRLVVAPLFFVACTPAETGEDPDHPCQLENHCVREGGELRCEDGYSWEDPDDEDNYNCVAIGGEGEGEGEGSVVEFGLPGGGHPFQGYFTLGGGSGENSDLWTTFDMDGDGLPDLVRTAKMTNGDWKQLGFPDDGHWLVHKNTGGRFAATGTKWSLPAGGHPFQGYFTTGGGSGENSDLWTTLDMDGDGLPDLVRTAKMQNGDWMQLGFPDDGHWLVHKNTGSGFSSTGTKWRLPGGGHPFQGYFTTGGGSGDNSDLWSLVDMNGDARPDLVVTARMTNGDWVQLGFPDDGHWLVHTNTGSGFAR